jgi:hypothetical protein
MGTGRNWNPAEAAAATLVFMEVSRMQQMSGGQLYREAARSFFKHLTSIKNHHLFKHITEWPKEGDRDGEQIWKKQGEIRAEMVNVIGPLWNKMTPKGALPSGRQMDELLATVKKMYYEELQRLKERTALQVTNAT